MSDIGLLLITLVICFTFYKTTKLEVEHRKHSSINVQVKDKS